MPPDVWREDWGAGKKQMELDCRKAQQMINGYIKDTLDERELQAFLDHVRECPSCYEELEIYYTIHLALDYLDDGHGAVNPGQQLVREIDAKYRELYKVKILQIIRNILTAAALAAAVLTAVIQVNYLATGRQGLILTGAAEAGEEKDEGEEKAQDAGKAQNAGKDEAEEKDEVEEKGEGEEKPQGAEKAQGAEKSEGAEKGEEGPEAGGTV